MAITPRNKSIVSSGPLFLDVRHTGLELSSRVTEGRSMLDTLRGRRWEYVSLRHCWRGVPRCPKKSSGSLREYILAFLWRGDDISSIIWSLDRGTLSSSLRLISNKFITNIDVWWHNIVQIRDEIILITFGLFRPYWESYFVLYTAGTWTLLIDVVLFLQNNQCSFLRQDGPHLFLYRYLLNHSVNFELDFCVIDAF